MEVENRRDHVPDMRDGTSRTLAGWAGSMEKPLKKDQGVGPGHQHRRQRNRVKEEVTTHASRGWSDPGPKGQWAGRTGCKSDCHIRCSALLSSVLLSRQDSPERALKKHLSDRFSAAHQPPASFCSEKLTFLLRHRAI